MVGNRKTNFFANRRANMAIVMALAAPALVGVCGLSAETGYWFYLEKSAQKAADVAAYAGAVALRNGDSKEKAIAVAMTEAELLGFDDPASIVVAVTPPTSGPNQHARAMEVTIDFEVPRFFSGIFNKESERGDVRAVAAYDTPSNACLLALDIDDPAALTISGSADVTLLSCEVMSNSIASDAVLLSGSGDLETDCVNAVGGVVVKVGGTELTLTDCNAPRQNMARAPDPYADVPEPDLDGVPCSSPGSGSGVVTVTAGAGGVKRFCGGLSLSGDYHFEPGVYVIDGGDFRLNSSTTVTGDDVTFFFTDGAEARFNGTATIDVAAPTTGTYQGIAFMGDRSDTSAEHRFNGTANSLITGAIYTPASRLVLNGDFSGVDGCMQLVGSTIELLGNMHISTDCEGYGLKWAQVPGSVRMSE
jgi:hypothetical protein